MRGAICPQSATNNASASRGIPSILHNAAVCSRGRSHTARRRAGASQPRPTAANAPSARSASTRKRSRSALPAAPRAALAAAGSASIVRSRDDALVAFQPDLELLQILVRPPRVEHDAVDEILLRRPIAVGIPRKIGGIGEALVDETPRCL